MPRPQYRNAARRGPIADFILTCTRDRERSVPETETLRRVARALAPPDIVPREPQVAAGDGVLVAVANPGQGVFLRDDAVCLGGLFGEPGRWWVAGSPAPEGTYALARHDGRTVELLTDVAASRTIWYTLTDDVFLASTSQRALVALLGGLQLDPSAVSWLMSSGALGPETSWDARLSKVPPDTRLVLDRTTWRISLVSQPAAYDPSCAAGEESVQCLSDALTEVCSQLNVDLQHWLLPLSGGRDSRGILAFMAASGDVPRCITWTTPAGLRQPLSDARIARRVARRFGAPHQFTVLEWPHDSAGERLDRFVRASEGLTDEFAGYADGLAVWRDLFDAGEHGIIRGDESMGLRHRAASVESTRVLSGGLMVRDFAPDHVLHRLHLAEQSWPERLTQRPDEDIEAYQDRLDLQGYVAIILAPLNGIKCRYVEVVCPLLSRAVIGAVRSLPQAERMYARAFIRLIARQAPWIPVARFSSTPSSQEFLHDAGMLEAIVRDMTSSVESVLPEEGALAILAAMASDATEAPTARARVRETLKALRVALPSSLADRLSPRFAGPDPLPPATVAFRAVLAARTIALLREDAALLTTTAGATTGATT